jgi:hypothetical protein
MESWLYVDARGKERENGASLLVCSPSRHGSVLSLVIMTFLSSLKSDERDYR